MEQGNFALLIHRDLKTYREQKSDICSRRLPYPPTYRKVNTGIKKPPFGDFTPEQGTGKPDMSKMVQKHENINLRRKKHEYKIIL